MADILSTLITIRFVLELSAAAIASTRGWKSLPFVLVGLSLLPTLYVHVTTQPLDLQDLLWWGMVSESVSIGLYVGLALMILCPRRDPRQSRIPIVLAAIVVGVLPRLALEPLGGLERFTGGRSAERVREAALSVQEGGAASARADGLRDRLVEGWERAPAIDADSLKQVFKDKRILPMDR